MIDNSPGRMSRLHLAGGSYRGGKAKPMELETARGAKGDQMGESKRRTVHAAVHGISSAAADKGSLMAIGFAAFVATSKMPIPDSELPRWRDAFFAGAQHLWASVFEVLDEDAEPTEQDMRRMDLLNHELTAWRDDINARMGNPLDEVQPKPDA